MRSVKHDLIFDGEEAVRVMYVTADTTGDEMTVRASPRETEAILHAVEAVCRTCGVLCWGEYGAEESIQFRASEHRRETGHDVEIQHDLPEWSHPMVAEINGEPNPRWWQ